MSIYKHLNNWKALNYYKVKKRTKQNWFLNSIEIRFSKWIFGKYSWLCRTIRWIATTKLLCFALFCGYSSYSPCGEIQVVSSLLIQIYYWRGKTMFFNRALELVIYKSRNTVKLCKFSLQFSVKSWSENPSKHDLRETMMFFV